MIKPGFHIGPVAIDAPVFLAPMSGVSDLPFRRIVKRFGAGLVFSEMIASRPMLEQFKRNPESLEADYRDEFPMAVQLAGCDPEIMAEAAKVHEARGGAIIDINFGCPVKKVVSSYAGSALMRDEDLATQIMDAVVRAVNVPVTVKMRLGWDDNSLNAPSLAKKAEDVGIKMVTVHGRTRCQLYNGNADWNAVARVREAITLPLIVNGDILNAQDAVQAMQNSGADGVMIGRGACGKPWVLKQVMDYIKTGSYAEPIVDMAELVEGHYCAMIEHYGEHQGNIISRKHIGWYCEGYEGGDAFRGRVCTMKNPDDVRCEIREFFTRAKTALAA
jgi:tRNA-dihydrouridine synthase B